MSDGAGAAGPGVDDISESFAKKLTSKLGKPVYFRQVPTHGNEFHPEEVLYVASFTSFTSKF